MQEELRELDERWTKAEIEADAATLDALAVDDFTLVGRRVSCSPSNNGSTATAGAIC
jgi:hypothetical protein